MNRKLIKGLKQTKKIVRELKKKTKMTWGTESYILPTFPEKYFIF